MKKVTGNGLAERRIVACYLNSRSLPDLFDRSLVDGNSRGEVILVELLKGLAENGLLANLNKDRWMRHIREARIPTLSQALRDKVLTCLNVLDSRNRIVRHPRSMAGDPADDPAWLDLALDSHQTSPLQGIVLSQVLFNGCGRQCDALIEFFGSLDSDRWEARKKRTLNLRKSETEYRAKLAPILKYARALSLIDPYLNPHQPRYFDTVSICSNLMGQRGHARLQGRVHLHAELKSQIPYGLTKADYLNAWEQRLRPLAKADGHRFHVFLWDSLPGSETLHDRYILTDQCCISTPGGLDCRSQSHANRTVWSLLDEGDRQQVTSDYDRATTPFSLEADREVS